MSYDEDRKWSDRFLPQVCDIVGPRLLVPAPLRQDRLEATDLIVLRARDMTIGVRLRRPGYSSRYPGEFTLRARRATGVPTELTKIVEGWGDWLFYGHTDTDGGIPVWMLLDLNKLRTAFMLHPFLLRDESHSITGIRGNGDGTSFRYFHAASIRPHIIIAERVGTRQIGELFGPTERLSAAS